MLLQQSKPNRTFSLMQKVFALLLVAVSIEILFASTTEGADAKKQIAPNIVFILADDK